MASSVSPRQDATMKPEEFTSGGTSTLKNELEISQESMAEPELLALIIELRLKASGDARKDKVGTTQSSNSNNNTSFSSASGDTLDLCHRKIEKLPHDMVEIIRDDVVRLALGYNLISTLPSNFCELSKLRYLNIRANLITIFPSVLCTLPSLEILDISRNKIRKLPSESGRLSDLRVLSISNNRLRKLPLWIQRARHLRILKVEGNPITWPPPHISVMPPFDKASINSQDREIVEGDGDSRQSSKKRAEDRHMALWIQKLKQWMVDDQEGSGEEQVQPASIKSQRNNLDAHRKDNSFQRTEPLKIRKALLPTEIEDKTEEEEQNSHTPSESTINIGAAFLSVGDEAESDEDQKKDDAIMALPIKIPLDASDPVLSPAKTASAGISSPLGKAVMPDIISGNAIIDSVKPLYTSPEQFRRREKSKEPLAATTGPALQQAIDVKVSDFIREFKDAVKDSQDGRNSSLSNVPSPVSGMSSMASTLRRGFVRNKKSFPELRQTHENVISETQSPVIIDGNIVQSSLRPRLPSTNASKQTIMPQVSGDMMTNGSNHVEEGDDKHQSSQTELLGAGTSTPMNNNRSAEITVYDVGQSAATVEMERNNYFRRYSTMPASTISKSIPVPVLQCIDATRGILYALSQMHSALKQYITFASDERMTSQLSRALAIASTSMADLINSLDHFDSLSRTKGAILNPIVIREVIVSCSESVSTFRKVISLLHLQLKTLERAADIRYSRTLLLLLYGSLAEIAHGWKVMEPLFTQVIPYLKGQEAEAANTSSTPFALPSATSQTYTLPSIAETSSPILANGDGSAASYAAIHLRPHRRRHAGSFSAQDVVNGAQMIPSAPLPTNRLEEIRRGQRPTALGPFAEQQQAKSMSYQVQQGDLDGTDLIHTGRAAPNESSERTSPHTPNDRLRRNEAEKHHTYKRSVSNTSASSQVSAFARPLGSNNGSNLHSAGGALNSGGMNKVLIDDHLVLLLVKVTSIAYSVWASIMDHLNTINTSALQSSVLHEKHETQDGTPEHTPNLDQGRFAAMSPHTPLQRNDLHKDASTLNEEQKIALLSPASSIGMAASTLIDKKEGGSNSTSKLQNLREMVLGLVEQTNQLQACCDKVQERSGISSTSGTNKTHQNQRAEIQSSSSLSQGDLFQEIYIESSSFIKSILTISQYIKNLSIDHPLPKVIKINLAQLTTSARDLTLHLHFLGGPTTSQSSKIASPAA